MTQIANVAEARALIKAGKVHYATDVHISRTGNRTVSFRWFLETAGAENEQLLGQSARLLTMATKQGATISPAILAARAVQQEALYRAMNG